MLRLLLFNLFIIDLPEVCDDAGILTYADDTVIFGHLENSEQLAAELSQIMSKPSEWLHHLLTNLKILYEIVCNVIYKVGPKELAL